MLLVLLSIEISDDHLIRKKLVFIENQEADFLALSQKIQSTAFIFFRNLPA